MIGKLKEILEYGILALMIAAGLTLIACVFILLSGGGYADCPFRW